MTTTMMTIMMVIYSLQHDENDHDDNVVDDFSEDGAYSVDDYADDYSEVDNNY